MPLTTTTDAIAITTNESIGLTLTMPHRGRERALSAVLAHGSSARTGSLNQAREAADFVDNARFAVTPHGNRLSFPGVGT
jgi:hypothetical protein